MNSLTRTSPDKLRSFRPDIEGLRAVAVLLVLFGHATTWIPGGYIGVDVFFVISGYLITGLLTNELLQTGRISFKGFYARRARRILPAALVVILATLAASWLWAPSTQRHDVSLDALWSAISVVNYELAAWGTDYFANTAPSPFQHYWSLAVEEQFYLFWPVILLMGWASIKRLGGLVLTMLVIAGASLALSVILTQGNQPWAYFGLPTRAWELAIGGIVALLVPYLLRLPSWGAAPLSWAGLGAIGYAAWTFNDATPFPGYMALVPVIGAALVIAGGCAAPRFGAELLLGMAAPRFIGRISYSLYLWHWPVLVLAPWFLGVQRLDGYDRAAVIVASLVLAVFSYYLVETPFREKNKFTSTNGRSLAFGGVAMATTAVLALALAFVTAPKGMPQRPTDNFVATSIVAKVEEGAYLRELPANLEGTLSSVSKDKPEGCSVRIEDVEPTFCEIGDTSSSTVVALIGDSHAWQWMPAFDLIGKREGFRAVVFTKDACTPEGISYVLNKLKRTYTECDTWRDNMMIAVGNLRPSLVVFSSLIRDNASSQVMQEFIRQLRSIGPGKTPVAFIDDTPKPGINIPDCLSQSSTRECMVPRGKAVYSAKLREARRTGAKRAGAMVIDPARWFCTATDCPPVIDGIVVYFDDNHMSATYAGRLAYDLGKTLRPVLP